jgi:hypothetical protein
MDIIRTYKSLVRIVFLGLLAVSQSACSSGSSNYLRKDLANTGPMILSRDNPYIASNLFVANECSESAFMDGFVKHRGAPDAIEVTDKYFKPFRVYFFYLQSREAYLFEEGSKEWIIRGPQRIPDEVIGRFGDVRSTAGKSAPLVNAPTGPSSPVSPEEKENSVTETNLGVAPAPTPSVQLGSQYRKRKSATLRPTDMPPEDNYATEEPTTTPPILTKHGESAGRSALEPAAPAALPSSKAYSDSFPTDIVHQVTYPRETLRMIASWYTDSPENAARIARINGIENPNVLQLDQRVRIPGYLLKRTEPMPQSEIQRYLSGTANYGGLR